MVPMCVPFKTISTEVFRLAVIFDRVLSQSKDSYLPKSKMEISPGHIILATGQPVFSVNYPLYVGHGKTPNFYGKTLNFHRFCIKIKSFLKNVNFMVSKC